VILLNKYISEKDFNFQMKEIQKRNLSMERKRMLDAERKKGLAKPKTPSASKMVLLGVIVLCVQIVVFCEYAMLTLGDASAMYVLIGIPAALAPIVWGYYSKSKAENVAGGIVYESAMAEMRSKSENEPADSTVYESVTTETRFKNEGGYETDNSPGNVAG
jgi:hypothetical protein